MTDSLWPEGNYPGRMTPPQPSTGPESQGISSHALMRFLDGCEQAGLELHAFELRRHGRTLAVHLLELENTGTLSLHLRALDGGDRLEAQAGFLRSFRQEGPLSAVGTLEG